MPFDKSVIPRNFVFFKIMWIKCIYRLSLAAQIGVNVCARKKSTRGGMIWARKPPADPTDNTRWEFMQYHCN